MIKTFKNILQHSTYLVVLITILFVGCKPKETPAPAIVYPKLFSLNITHNNQKRAYLLYVPKGYDKNIAWPLVINMHGRGSTNQEQILYSNFNLLADEHKFIVAYPQGLIGTVGDVTATHWNANFGTGVDDVGFIGAMLDEIYIEYNFDIAKVYAIGMSNGGFMSYTLACDMSDRIAAIASVAGAMDGSSLTICNPQRSIPVMQFHGTADSVVPYFGFGGQPPTVPDAVNFWVTNNQCDTTKFTEVDLPDIVLTDSSTVTKKHYNVCNQSSEVIFYTINNGGHTWPGALLVPSLGNTNQDITASELIWEFLNSHSHPNPKVPGS